MKQKLLYTDWYARFQCVGGSCPLTCCAGWQISLRDNEIEMYRGMEQPCAAAIWDAVDEENKKMKLRNGRCRLLTEDNLCTIVLNCGAEYLSLTCSVFPRVVAAFGDTQEANVEIVCPVVAGWMFDKEPMSFGFGESEAASVGTADYVLYDALTAVRAYLVELFQLPDTAGETIGGKIYIMLDMMDKLSELYEARNLTSETAASCVDSYNREEIYDALYPSCETLIRNMELKAERLQWFFAELGKAGMFQKVICAIEQKLPDVWKFIQENNYLDAEHIHRVLPEFVAWFREQSGTFSSNWFVYSLFSDWLPDGLNMEKFGVKIRLRIMELALIQYFAMILWMKEGGEDYRRHLCSVDCDRGESMVAPEESAGAFEKIYGKRRRRQDRKSAVSSRCLADRGFTRLQSRKRIK